MFFEAVILPKFVTIGGELGLLMIIAMIITIIILDPLVLGVGIGGHI